MWKWFWGIKEKNDNVVEHVSILIIYYIALNVEDFREGGQRWLPWVSRSPSSYVCLIQDLVNSAIHPAVVCHSCPASQLNFNKAALLLRVCGRKWLRVPVLLWCLQWQCTPCVKRGGKLLKGGTGEGWFHKLVIFPFPFLLSFSILLFFSYRKNYFVVLGVKEAQNKNLQR